MEEEHGELDLEGSLQLQECSIFKMLVIGVYHHQCCRLPVPTVLQTVLPASIYYAATCEPTNQM